MKRANLGAVGLVVFLSITACDNSPFASKSDDAKGKGVCASVTTSVGVKAALFGKSRQGNPGAEARISELEQGSAARLEQPIVDQVEQQTGKTTCSATLVLSLRPGSKASKGIDEEQKIRIRYSVQPSADGNDLVYEVFGGEALAAALAGKQSAEKKNAQPTAAPPLAPGNVAQLRVKEPYSGPMCQIVTADDGPSIGIGEAVPLSQKASIVAKLPAIRRQHPNRILDWVCEGGE